jgi:hypothetical protein
MSARPPVPKILIYYYIRIALCNVGLYSIRSSSSVKLYKRLIHSRPIRFLFSRVRLGPRRRRSTVDTILQHTGVGEEKKRILTFLSKGGTEISWRIHTRLYIPSRHHKGQIENPWRRRSFWRLYSSTIKAFRVTDLFNVLFCGGYRSGIFRLLLLDV